MRKLFLAVLAALLILPASALARPGFHGGGGHGGFHGGFRGGFRGRVVVGPFWGWGWGWPYYYGGYAYGSEYGYGAFPSDWTVVDTDVSPEEARVYLDGRFIGTADDFDGYPDYLYLRPGQYKLEFRLEGYESQTVNVDARPGVKLDFNNKLRKIPGARQHGSYESPQPEGGVLRYWGKRRGAPEAYDGGGPPPRDRRDRNDIEAEPDGDQAPPPPAAPPAERPADDRGPSGLRDDGWRHATPRAARQRAWLLVSVQPADAAVYLDDRFVGTAEEVNGADRGLPLTPGKHTITVSRPGFKDRSVEVEISAGQSKKIDVSLDK
jgi:hypothetical protein